MFCLSHQRSEENDNEGIHCSSFQRPDSHMIGNHYHETFSALWYSLNSRTVSGIPFVFRLRLTPRCLMFYVLLSPFIGLKLIFLFVNRSHVLSVLLPSLIGLDLIFFFANRRHVHHIMLMSFIDLNFVPSFPHRCHVLSVMLTSFIDQNFFFLFAEDAHLLFVFLTFPCDLNFFFLSPYRRLAYCLFLKPVLSLILIFSLADRNHARSARPTPLIGLNFVLFFALKG